MTLESKINTQWQILLTEIGANGQPQSSEKFEKAKQSLFHILNIPSTTFNVARLCDLLTKGIGVEEFLKGADRYLPLSDLQSEAALRKYLEMYTQIRGRIDPGDIVAFYRADASPENEKTAEGWLQEKIPFEKMRQKLEPKS